MRIFGGTEGWRHRLAQLLHTHDTPQRTAAAYAIGVFFGFSPFLGLHTVLGLCVAFALNLNRVAVLVGVYSNLPWILPPYYTLTTLLGAALLRVEVPAGLLTELGATLTAGSWREMRQHAEVLAPLAWAYALGSTLGAVVLALVAYRVSLSVILTHRQRKELYKSQRTRDLGD
jgi:uncharacterized protein (DUF2062 family)